MRKPLLEQELFGGVQKRYRFKNDFGASVIRHKGSYGRENGLWELAVTRYTGPGDEDCTLTYETPITDDVIGHLTDEQVDELLERIEALTADESVDYAPPSIETLFEKLGETMDSLSSMVEYEETNRE